MYSIEDIELVALNLMRRKQKGNNEIFIRRFRARFGVDPTTVLILWGMLETDGRFDIVETPLNLEHLFWALDFLKNYSNETVQADKFGVDSKTYRKWFWVYVKAIASLAPKVVSFNSHINVIILYRSIFYIVSNFK